jgi:pimeloyl-ACP methyl ester carboxylesterase
MPIVVRHFALPELRGITMRLISGLVITMALITSNAARAGGPADVLDKAPSRYAKSGERKVHYKSIGEGKTAVVFIHGWCCDHSVWRDQAAAFNGKVRMLFVDLPGYGKSDHPKIEYTMDVFAKGVDAVVEDAGVEKAILVGHSMGTPVARQFYRLFPEKTKAIIFVDGALRSFAKTEADADKFLSVFKEETFKDTAPKMFASMFKANTPEAVRDHIAKLVANTTPHVAISSMRGMVDPKVWKGDPIKVPCQAIMAKTPFWNEDYKKFARTLVPDLDYREFDNVGHMLFMEDPIAVNAAMGEFLKKQGVVK